MNRVIFISLIFFLATASCIKENPNPAKTGETLPFENESIKLEVISSTVPANVRGIHFFTPATGIAITYDGKIYKSIDNGITWSLQYSNPVPDQPFYQVIFTDSNTGYIVGGSNSCGGTGCIPSGGVILKTTDGGNNWTNIFRKSRVTFVSIASNSSGDLFAISNGTKGRIHKSINGGINWITIDSTDFNLDKITFSNNLGFCLGKNGKILRSNDNGNNWELAATLSANYAHDIKFNSGSGYCIANNQTVYKTTDNGTTWTQKFDSDFQTYIVNPLTSDNCLAFGSGRSYGDFVLVTYGAIWQTTNSGNDWTEIQFNNITSIRYSSFYSDSEGYVSSGTELIKVTVK
jgi:photosystem II stability/assembly factor-like uncharacterized protein